MRIIKQTFLNLFCTAPSKSPMKTTATTADKGIVQMRLMFNTVVSGGGGESKIGKYMKKNKTKETPG